MRISFLLFALLITISSCNKKVKETMGLDSAGPDEYKVQRGKALEIPPHYNLEEPLQLENSKHTREQLSKNLDESEKSLLEEVEQKKK